MIDSKAPGQRLYESPGGIFFTWTAVSRVNNELSVSEEANTGDNSEKWKFEPFFFYHKEGKVHTRLEPITPHLSFYLHIFSVIKKIFIYENNGRQSQLNVMF